MDFHDLVFTFSKFGMHLTYINRFWWKVSKAFPCAFMFRPVPDPKFDFLSGGISIGLNKLQLTLHI